MTLLSERLNDYKARNAMSWEEVASELGVSIRSVMRWLNSDVVPRSFTVLKILVANKVLTTTEATALRKEWRARAGMFYPRKEK